MSTSRRRQLQFAAAIWILLTSTAAWATDAQPDCFELDDVSDRALCRASYYRDASMCDTLGSSDQVTRCTAIAGRSRATCATLVELEARKQCSSAVGSILSRDRNAEASDIELIQEPLVVNAIPLDGTVDTCEVVRYSRWQFSMCRADAYADADTCRQLTSYEQRRWCHAIARRDMTACYFLEADDKHLCRAVASRTRSHCRLIRNHDTLRRCFAQVDRAPHYCSSIGERSARTACSRLVRVLFRLNSR